MDREKKKFLSKRMDFLPLIFLQKERISKFLKEMSHSSVKDIIKLERLIIDFEADLWYYIKKQGIDIENLKKLKTQLHDLDKFMNDNYIDKLIEIGAELMFIAGVAGLLPDYRAGIPINVAE